MIIGNGNFEAAGVTDIVLSDNPTVFTLTKYDINAQAIRRDKDRYTVHSTNAIGPGSQILPGTYPLVGNLHNTDDIHYEFDYWTCVDIDGNNFISAIGSNEETTTITVTDRDLWVEAHYIVYYKLTVVEGQDTGDHYYYEGEEVTTVYANTPPVGSQLIFDKWLDPIGIIDNIYDETPTITMKDSIATITATYASLDTMVNSVTLTSDNLHSGIITRENTSVISGVFSVGTIVFDSDGCIGIITEVNPDGISGTNDYRVEKLFYGGNF